MDAFKGLGSSGANAVTLQQQQQQLQKQQLMQQHLMQQQQQQLQQQQQQQSAAMLGKSYYNTASGHRPDGYMTQMQQLQQRGTGSYDT